MFVDSNDTTYHKGRQSCTAVHSPVKEYRCLRVVAFRKQINDGRPSCPEVYCSLSYRIQRTNEKWENEFSVYGRGYSKISADDTLSNNQYTHNRRAAASFETETTFKEFKEKIPPIIIIGFAPYANVPYVRAVIPLVGAFELATCADNAK